MNTHPPPCRLWVVRHGETVWNRQERYQGHGDSPLTDAGQHQARAVGRRLASVPATSLIASDSGRVLQTARWISDATRLPMSTDERLRERHFGVFEGLTIPEIVATYPDIYDQYNRDDPDYVIPDGESFRQHYQRVTACFQELAADSDGRDSIVVTHGGVLDCLFRFITKIPLSQPRCMTMGNASVSVLSFGSFYGTNRWVIETWADVGHL